MKNIYQIPCLSEAVFIESCLSSGQLLIFNIYHIKFSRFFRHKLKTLSSWFEPSVFEYVIGSGIGQNKVRI